MEIKGPEYYAQWRADQAVRRESVPPPPSFQQAQRSAERTPVNMEARRTQMKDQIRGVQSRIEEANRAADRFRRDGLAEQAYAKEATVKTLESQVRQLRKDLDQLAA